jgi:diguanylate cyclase (GGDEF)-like protein
MQKEWSSFRITLLLYILVLILPLSFYFVYSSFKTIQNDTTIVHQTGWTGGAIESLALDPKSQNSQQTITQIDSALQDISGWVTQNDQSDLYIGAESLSQDFTQVKACWSNYKQILGQQDTAAIREHSLQCWEKADSFAIIVEKMVYLKQNKMINMFYFSLIVAMILTLLMIYMVRSYIHIQMKKHAIHDHETKLFNKKYFMSQLKTSCARSVRYKYPLSMLSISIDDFEKGSKIYDEKTKEHILKILGGLITSLTRTSDTACRYDEDHFSILLPDTEEENALILERRVREVFEKHDFMAKPELKFKFSTVPFNYDETPEAFITRTESLLS